MTLGKHVVVADALAEQRFLHFRGGGRHILQPKFLVTDYFRIFRVCLRGNAGFPRQSGVFLWRRQSQHCLSG
jgi:hypothetical protein